MSLKINQNKNKLIKFANEIRLKCLDMTSKGGSSHIGSILSIVDIVSVLYCCVIKFNIQNPKDPLRDRFILSKGHSGVCIYAILAKLGFFKSQELENFYKNGSRFSGHVSHIKIPGVELSTGSLGHGLGVGMGMALAAKLEKRNNHIYVLLSDGELDEGSNWEAFLFAPHNKLDNITVIIDYNKLQSLDSIQNTLNLEPLSSKFISFGWEVFHSMGHSHDDLLKNFISAKNSPKPSVVICHTTKGYGVDFMENSVLWHYRTPRGEEFLEAKKQLLKRMG
tara:strand:- start:1035 stop:1871 length:837 start_codon:yes stop_codon:yes gene_type:complete